MKITMTAISERQRARFYIYKKHKNAIQFYVQKAIHFSKIKKICVPFLYTKSKTLYVTRFFMKILNLEFIYTKSMTLCVSDAFIFKNPDTLQKARQFALRFYIQKA